MTLWQELIHIPEQVHSSDFVLKLSDGVQKAKHTVDSYVVTNGVANAFELALGLIGGALDDNKSKAAFLHGSFGSGKSHFMAMIDLLLTEEYAPLVKQKDKLMRRPKIQKQLERIEQKKLLMVPYHFLGAASVESCILGGYVAHVRELHPNAPVPGVYASQAIIENAIEMRANTGDDMFFKLLNGDDDEDDDEDDWFGDDSWTAERFEAGVNADPNTEERALLVGALVSTIFSSMQEMAMANEVTGGFVNLDIGLQIITQHARDLGYDGLVLFLDELVLWLSRKASDLDFIHKEEQKLVKLVEAQNADRPIPIISFVARQRSLTEFIGDHYTGMEQATFSLSVDLLEGRFDTINLEDRDLPLIAQERILKPKDPIAAEKIQQAFERYIKSISTRHRDLMRTRDTDDAMFGKVFPFSPALVQALVALSTFLQRERTALRLLLLLLVHHREQLRLGQVVPVGDLWDVVTQGQQPFSDALRRTYQHAVELWEKKLRPLLIKEYGFDPDDHGEVNPHQLLLWHNDARLLKTLLIASLVPQVDALKDMTVSKLTALNLSAVSAPFSGMEESVVFTKLQKWAGEVSELRLSDDHDDPRVQLQLTTLDPEILLDQVATYDSPGRRRLKVHELLLDFLKLDSGNNSEHTRYKVAWRGGWRYAKIYYRNIRELSTASLRASDGEWSIILDYPFDEQGFSVKHDEDLLEKFVRQDKEGTNTIAWLPNFMSMNSQQRLGRFVRIERILQRFDDYAQELPQKDRPLMRQLLENQRDQLRALMRNTLETAYGLSRDNLEYIDQTFAVRHHLISLRHNHSPKMPAGQRFDATLEGIFFDALEAEYPDIADLPHEVLSSGNAKKILDALKLVIQSGDNSLIIDDKQVMTLCSKFAYPIGLCELKPNSNRLAYDTHWAMEIEKALGADVERVHVADIRDIINPPNAPTGLPRVLVDLIICTYAIREQMGLVKLGVEQHLVPGKLDDAAELVRRELPDAKTWERAIELRATFDINQDFAIRDVRNVEQYAKLLRTRFDATRDKANALPDLLLKAGQMLHLEDSTIKASKRYKSVVALQQMVERHKLDDTALINAFVKQMEDDFAMASLPKLIDKLSLIHQQLKDQKWTYFKNAFEHDYQEERTLCREAQEILQSAEHVSELKKINNLHDRLIKLIIARPQAPKPDPTPPKTTTLKHIKVQSITDLDTLRQTLEAMFNKHGSLSVDIRTNDQ